jgi:sugar lactone lactonase YvrE
MPLPGSGTGNRNDAPLFLDQAGGNLRLQTNSPCIDAGNNAYAPGTTDLDGNPRIVGTSVDMGAYEFQGLPVTITLQPLSQKILAGGTATFAVGVTGSTPMSYQWSKDGTNVLNGARVSGATTSILSISNVAVSDAGAYSALVSNAYGSSNSTSAVLAVLIYEPYTFTTLAGTANGGATDGVGAAARFNDPAGLAVDAVGNVYVADFINYTIRKISPDRTVTTIAGLAGNHGTNDGIGTQAQFYCPNGVAVDDAGNLYVSDRNNCTIRKITPGSGGWVVTTLAGSPGVPGSADGTGSAARFYAPGSLALDRATNVYVADAYNHTIRKVTPQAVVTTLAGLAGNAGSADGTNSDARFDEPDRVAVDGMGNLYVADYGNGTIRKVAPVGTNWVVTTLAGLAGHWGSTDGTGAAARFAAPEGVTVDSAGNVFVADGNCTVRKITAQGSVTTLAGFPGISATVDGTGSSARFNSPFGVALDGMGNLYVPDGWGNTVRKGWVSTATNAPVITAQPQSLSVLAFSNATFQVGALGPGLLGFQWRKDGASLTDGGGITGAASDALTLTNVTFNATGSYTVVVTNAYGSVTSAVATLVVHAPAAVTLSNLFQTYDGTPKPVFYTTAPSGLAVNVTYNGSNNPPTSIGTYVVVGTIADLNYQGSATDTLIISCCCVPPAGGLVAWWTGDGSAVDIGGTNSGSFTNGAAYAPGVVGQALSFNGSNGVVVPDSPSLQFGTNDVTVEGWLQAAPGTTYRVLMQKEQETGNRYPSMTVMLLPGGQLAFEITDCGTASCQPDHNYVTSSNRLDDTRWHYFAGVRVSAGYLLYVDGRLDNTRPETARYSDNTWPLKIGCSEVGSFNFVGLLDELAIYKRALLASEIAAIYSAGSMGKCRPAVPAHLTTLARLGDGSIQFAFTNSIGAAFSVLATTNLNLSLSNWTVLGGVTEVSLGQFQFTDPQATNNPQRFYRIRSP